MNSLESSVVLFESLCLLYLLVWCSFEFDEFELCAVCGRACSPCSIELYTGKGRDKQ